MKRPSFLVPGRCFVIAEIAQAHDGSLGQAHAYIDAAAAAGADAVKFQTHIAEAESSPAEPWRVKFSYQDDTRFEYWQRMEFTPSQWQGLKQHADEKGITFLSSPFSIEAVELLERLGIAAWKIASGEVSNRPMMEAMAATGKPLLVSTGMSGFAEIDDVVAWVRRRDLPLLLFQCTSAYPSPPDKIGLNLLGELRDRYGVAVGLSDHSGTIYPGLAAVALGCDCVEVHLTMSREMFGPDVVASITSAELRQLVEGVRFTERMRANPIDKDAFAASMEPMRNLFTKSVFLRRPIEAGQPFTSDHLTTKKPGTGMPAKRMPELVGRRAARDLPAGHMLEDSDIEAPA